MPFQKGFNRWALPHDELDIESMKLSMAFNAWGIPAFKKLFMYEDLGIMDYNKLRNIQADTDMRKSIALASTKK